MLDFRGFVTQQKFPNPSQPSDRALCAQVWLVAVDDAGNAQDNPTLVALRTLPDTTPPALLVGSGANGVTRSLVPVAQCKQSLQSLLSSLQVTIAYMQTATYCCNER